MNKRFSKKIGDVFQVPLDNNTYGIVQRAYIDINRLGYDIIILYNINSKSEITNFKCSDLNHALIKTSAYTNTISGFKNNAWKIISNCPLPTKYQIPLFKEYCGPPYTYDGIHKWRIYDPITGEYRRPLNNMELLGLVTHVGFTPKDIENWLFYGTHGLTHEMFS